MGLIKGIEEAREALRVAAFGTGSIFDTKPETAPAWNRTEKGEGWEGYVYGFFPTQGNGTIDGWHWYYRSRHGMWTIGIGATEDLVGSLSFDFENVNGFVTAADVADGYEQFIGGWRAEGDADEPDPVLAAWERIKESFRAFRAAKGA